MTTLFRRLLEIVSNRLVVLCLIILGMFYILFNRIFDLQIIQGETLGNEFSLSIVKERELEGQRGNIYDRYGYPLAENVLAYNVLLDGSIHVDNINQMIYELTTIIENSGDKTVNSLPIAINEDGNFIFTEEENQILRFKKSIFLKDSSDTLSEQEKSISANNLFIYLRDELFEIPSDIYSDSDVLSVLNIRYPLWLNRYTQYQLETVSININEKTLARIEESLWKFPGVSIVEDPLRVYNDANYFAHIIGYTGRIDAGTLVELEPLGYKADDIVGKIGIEQKMESYLKGSNGTQTVEVDNLGRTMEIISTEPATSGEDVYLTIDRDLQIQSYNILENKLAYLLQSTLAMSGYEGNDKDDNVTLMRDVFSSLFNNEIISIEMLEKSSDNQTQNDIYTEFLSQYNDIVYDMEYALNNYNLNPSESEIDYYKYILKKLNQEGYLNNDYDQIEMYGQLLNKEMSFKELLEIYSNVGITILENADSSKTNYENLKDIIINDVLKYHSFKKKIYVDMAEDEEFYYSKLCLTLIEQGVVTATEDQISDLSRGYLDAVTFMKEKITKLEITPQELALDPCSGSVVVTDVNTGEVLALVSYPSYDNNRLVNNFDYTYYKKLLEDPTSPLYPMATQGKTAPGSTFKMVTAIAGMEEGVIGPRETIVDQGIFQKIFPSARCWIYSYSGGTHGAVSVASALEVSCNYFYYELGYRLSKADDGSYDDSAGIDNLVKYATMLGLGTPTGIEIDDADSSLPVQDAVRTSIGQSSNSFTPVQLSRYVSTLANNGYCYELSVIDKVLDKKGNLIFEKTPELPDQQIFAADTMEVVKEGMRLVTSGSRGTARNFFNTFPIEVAGKTGTAQQSKTRPDHGIFVGYAPYVNPEVSVVCVIPFGYGSAVPTDAAKQVFTAYYETGEINHDDIYSNQHLLDE